jgi:hypothetical protein
MDRRPERLLDAAPPRWDITERHARMVLAPPDCVWQALREVLGLVAPTLLRVDGHSVAALRPVDVDDLSRPALISPRVTGRSSMELVIRPGSGLIRRELLRAVARRAEAAGG